MGMHIWQADPPKSITVRCLGIVNAGASPLTHLTKLGLTFSLLPGTQDIEVIGPLIEKGHPVIIQSKHLSVQSIGIPPLRLIFFFNTVFLKLTVSLKPQGLLRTVQPILGY